MPALPVMDTNTGGYVEPTSDLIDLSVRCLNGEGCELRLGSSALGSDLQKLVSEQLPSKKGRGFTLHYMNSPLMLQHTLQGQGIVGKTAIVSCTFVPTDLCAAWCCLQSDSLPGKTDAQEPLQGITRIAGMCCTKSSLPSSLESLIFGHKFNETLNGVTFPSRLQGLTFGYHFDQSLRGVTLPTGLKTLTFGCSFNKSLEGLTFPSSLQSLTFGRLFNQRLDLESVIFPSGLQNLTFGDNFDRSLQGVTLPNGLQSLTFGSNFNQSLEGVNLPIGLQSLVFGWRFDQGLEGVNLPTGLQSMAFGH